MSRTYRLKNKFYDELNLSRSFFWWARKQGKTIDFTDGDKESTEATKFAKREVAYLFSDNHAKMLRVSHGPSWFHRLYSQKPHRLDSRIQIGKFMQNNEFEVILPNKPKRTYWN